MPITTDLEDDDVQDSSELDPRVRKYFEDMVAQGGRVDSPDYQRQVAGSRTADADASIGRAQLAGIAEGLSKVGTLNGKSPDVKPLTTTLSGLESAQRQRSAGMAADEDDAQKRQGMNTKVYEYLQSRSDKTREAQAQRDARSSDSAASLAAKAQEGALNREAAAQRQREHGETLAAIRSSKPEKPEKDPNGDQFKAAGFARRLEAAEQDFEELTKGGYDRSSTGEALANKLPEGMKGEATKRQSQAERNFVNAVLRRESGAAISPSEFESAEAQYFPRIGDTPQLHEQKRRNREQKKLELIAEGGRAYEKVPLAARRDVVEPPAAGTATAAPAAGARTVVKQQHNKALNKTRIIYSDGSTEERDGLQ